MKDRIKKARKSAGLTQQALADMVGIGKQSITYYEGGQRTPLAPVVRTIANACGVNEEWLLTGDGEMYSPKTREEEMAEIALSLYENKDDLRMALLMTVAKLSTEQIEEIYNLAERLVQAKEKHAQD